VGQGKLVEGQGCFGSINLRMSSGFAISAPVRFLIYSRCEPDPVRSSQPLVLRFWSRSREIRVKRKSGRVRAVMRKLEAVEPR
jgi:hypothetical protein